MTENFKIKFPHLYEYDIMFANERETGSMSLYFIEYGERFREEMEKEANEYREMLISRYHLGNNEKIHQDYFGECK
jgi:hypothetical protein